MILFQPCPYHFPDLWKVESPVLPELEAWQIQAARETYCLPEDGTREAVELCGIWRVERVEEIARRYAELRFRTSHGFLVEDGHLLKSACVIRDLDTLELLKGEGMQLEEACFVRARRFSLPVTTPRLCWSWSMGRAHETRTVCIPFARETWPPIE